MYTLATQNPICPIHCPRLWLPLGPKHLQLLAYYYTQKSSVNSWQAKSRLPSAKQLRPFFKVAYATFSARRDPYKMADVYCISGWAEIWPHRPLCGMFFYMILLFLLVTLVLWGFLSFLNKPGHVPYKIHLKPYHITNENLYKRMKSCHSRQLG